MQTYHEAVTHNINTKKVVLAFYKGLKEWLIQRNEAFLAKGGQVEDFTPFSKEDITSLQNQIQLPTGITANIEIYAIYVGSFSGKEINFNIAIKGEDVVPANNHESFDRDDIIVDAFFLRECANLDTQITKISHEVETLGRMSDNVLLNFFPLLERAENDLRRFITDCEAHESKTVKDFLQTHILPLMVKKALQP